MWLNNLFHSLSARREDKSSVMNLEIKTEREREKKTEKGQTRPDASVMFLT